jgi:hypothetical protein
MILGLNDSSVETNPWNRGVSSREIMKDFNSETGEFPTNISTGSQNNGFFKL